MRMLVFSACIAAFAAGLPCAAAERVSAGDCVEFIARNAEIVVADGASPVVRFAAKEAKTFLSEALGAEVPVVNAPTAGRASLVLGQNEWSAGAGLSTNSMARDEFLIAARGTRVYVLGRDSATVDPEKMLHYGGWGSVLYERATLFGVYDLLERFAGVRFYFPGELGTIVPKSASVAVRGSVSVSPDFTSRFMQAWHGKYMEPDKDGYKKTLNYLRLRYETSRKPCCHGSNGMMYTTRFGKSHPEYFALLQDGSRCSSVERVSAEIQPGQLCWSSGVVDEMFLDAASYLKGEPASVRGIPSRDVKGKMGWNGNCSRRRYVDLMPQDGWTGCLCDKCRGRREGDLVWSAMTNIAWRLKREGIAGEIVNMAYSGCKAIPDFEFPDNIQVMVAPVGPWSVKCADLLAKENAIVAGWARKLGHKVWLWNYANKWGVLVRKAAGIPTPAPRAWAAYFKALAPYIDGAFVESETDRWFNNQLNYYVYSRVCWDNAVDVEAVLDEYFRNMFGKASAEMSEVFRRLEDWWIGEFVGNVVDTPMGPVVQPPKDSAVWGRIYGPARLEGLEALFAEARGKVAPGSLEARRVDMVEREFLDPLKASARKYFEEHAKMKDYRLVLPVGGSATAKLRPFTTNPARKLKPTVSTTVGISRTADSLVFEFDCEEPLMHDRAAGNHKADDTRLWMDDCVEVVMFPDPASPERSYHFFLNSSGSWTDSFDGDPRQGAKWNSGMRTSVSHRRDGWTGRFEIPLAAFPGLKDEIPFEVARERNLRTEPNIHHLYNWSPCAHGFSDLDNLGVIVMEKQCRPKGVDLSAQALAAAAAAGVRPGQGGTLRIYTWSDYIAPDVIAGFERALGVKVVVDTFDSNEDMYALLKSGGASYDIAMPSSYQIEAMADAGMIDELDHTKIPNARKNFEPSFASQILDPSFAYSVPYAMTYTGLAYRKDRLPAGVSVDSWAVLGNPALKGRVMLLDDIREVIGIGLVYLGYSVNSSDPAEINAAADQVIKWRANVRGFDSEGYKTEVSSGESWVAQGYSTDVAQIIAGKGKSGAPGNGDVGFAIPKEGFAMAFDEMVVMKSAPRKDLAYAFINYVYDGDVAKATMECICGSSPVKPGLAQLDPGFRAMITLSPAQLNSGQVLRGLDDQPGVMELYNKAWDRIRAAEAR